MPFITFHPATRSIACCVALMLTSHATAVDIVLREKITPVTSVISLGDLADIHGASHAEQQRLALTRLWVAPPVGQQRYVTARQIRDVLVSRGYRAEDLHFYGATQVQVGWAEPAAPPLPTETATAERDRTEMTTGFRPPRPANEIERRPERRPPIFLSAAQRAALAEQVQEEMVAYLEQHTSKPGRIEVEFQLHDRQADLLSQQTSELAITGGRPPWTGRQTLTVEFDSEVGPQQLPVSVDVYDTTPVLVAKRAIARGRMITAADVAIESPPRQARVPVGRELVYALDDALGKEAAQAIRAGQVVTADLCLPPLMMQRNEIVTLVSAGGGISIRRRGKALADARMGELAEVELLDSKQRLLARVVGRGELAVVGGGR